MDFKGKRILVIEDDQKTGMAIAQVLRDRGCVVHGPAPTIFYAAQLLGRRHVDAAILDTRLYGNAAFDFADELTRRGTPILFLAAPGTETLPRRHHGRPCLLKPCQDNAVIEAVAGLFVESTMAADQAAAPLVQHPRESQNSHHDRIVRIICALLRRDMDQARGAQAPPIPAPVRSAIPIPLHRAN